MASSARSISRFLMAATLSLGFVLQPVAAFAQEGMSLIRDTEIEETLKEDSTPIFQAAGFDPKAVQIILIGSKDIQAFAGPGVMAVYTGLILESKNPNELQGVMAHEIGHLAGAHSARRGEMTRAGIVPMILTMGLGVLAAMAPACRAAARTLTTPPHFGA